jgi:hypothetical protein
MLVCVRASQLSTCLGLLVRHLRRHENLALLHMVEMRVSSIYQPIKV